MLIKTESIDQSPGHYHVAANIKTSVALSPLGA